MPATSSGPRPWRFRAWAASATGGRILPRTRISPGQSLSPSPPRPPRNRTADMKVRVAKFVRCSSFANVSSSRTRRNTSIPSVFRATGLHGTPHLMTMCIRRSAMPSNTSRWAASLLITSRHMCIASIIASASVLLRAVLTHRSATAWRRSRKAGYVAVLRTKAPRACHACVVTVKASPFRKTVSQSVSALSSSAACIVPSEATISIMPCA
mmetsp:Transcript_112796/g.315132  ORF Transcript_112796/g.315132 Transcript_112796/m.315132 type:complete len:211 (-) Transcript_112796:70-702(-)